MNTNHPSRLQSRDQPQDRGVVSPLSPIPGPCHHVIAAFAMGIVCSWSISESEHATYVLLVSSIGSLGIVPA